MYNLLAGNGTLGYGVSQIADVNLNWIGQLIRILIEGIGIVGVGIIVFTLILKTIVLPLDIYSRINSKKQALIMDRMRPQMEKLQKQYANDKNMYNQKVMELQKKSGYSMFGACLPMIVSLVIFIIVFNAFSTYSQYANLRTYNDMVIKYNDVVLTYVVENPENPSTDDGFLFAVDSDGNYLKLDESGKPVDSSKTIYDYTADYQRFTTYYNNAKKAADTAWVEKNEEDTFTYLAAEYKEKKGDYAGDFNASMVNYKVGTEYSETAKALRNSLINYYMEEPAAQAVKAYYEDGHNNSFLWVKNIWYPDSTLNKEIPDFAKFKSTITQASITDVDGESYNKVTSALTEQKNAYNGYFILIVLSIGLMLLQQWLSMRANKSVNELGTVDGSGARTNKMMMIMMPIIYGIFSFFYSASFSLYMITNTVYSLITMLIINKCVDVWFKKKEERGELEEVLTKKSRKMRKAERAAKKARRVK
ncbi:MAG: YidC/Oxa1 family membrane protein insertase [Candidatus Coproplasma sp.]